MRYLKEYAESGYEKVLSDFGVSESEFNMMVDFLNNCSYSDVNDVSKYIISWSDGNRVTYDGVRQLINKYNHLVKREEKLDVSREVFLDIEESDGAKVTVMDNRISVVFKPTLDNLINISTKIKRNLERLGISKYTCGVSPGGVADRGTIDIVITLI